MDISELLKVIVENDGGAFAVVVSIAALLFFIVWKVAAILNRLKNIEDKQSDSKETFNRHEQTFLRIDSELSLIKSDIGTITGDLGFIRGLLMHDKACAVESNASAEGGMVQAHSPLGLSPLGEETATALDAQAMIDKNWDNKIHPKLLEEIKSWNPYDIQQYCMERVTVYPADYLSDADVYQIKTYAYSKGETIFRCMQVFAILIRDRFLKEHKILPEEPAKQKPANP